MATAKKARKRTRRKGEGTGEHILETALGLFRDKGFDATTMRDVARAADMSLGAAYYYFPSKEAIVLSYYEQVVERRRAKAEGLFRRDRRSAGADRRPLPPALRRGLRGP